MEETVLSCARDLLGLLGLEVSDLSVRREDDRRAIFFLSMRSPDSKLLIGPRGQTLATVEHFLGLLLERRLAQRVVTHVEVNDYRAGQDARLYAYVDGKIRDVQASGGRMALRPMTSYERKKVHAYVDAKGVPGLGTVSQDDPLGRTLYLSYEGKSALALDLDSAGI